MDNNNQPIQTNNPVSVDANSVASDLLVTQKVDISSIPPEQIAKDLELLKSKENGKKDNSVAIPIVKKKSVPSVFVTMDIKDIDILSLKNPFKGE